MMKYFTHFCLIVSFVLLVGCNSNVLEPGESLEISILTTTDLHGWILPWDYSSDTADNRYGLAKVATLVDSVRNRHPDALLLDAGDWLQGNDLANFFAKKGSDHPNYPLLQIADFIQYDAMVLGNHEFNFGIDYLNKRILQTETPILGANVYKTGSMEPAYLPYIIKSVRGVKVGILGLTTPGSMVWDKQQIEGNLDFKDGVLTAHHFIPEMKAQGAQVIIVLGHSSLGPESSIVDPHIPAENFMATLAKTVPDVHLIITGHSHRVVDGMHITGPEGFPVGVIQAGRWGSHLGIASIYITKDHNGIIQVDSVKTRAIPTRYTPPHKRVSTMMQDVHNTVRDYVNQTIVTTKETWSTADSRLKDNAVTDLIHAVQFEYTGAQLSAASVFNTTAVFGDGIITRRDLSAIYPYENMLYTLSITGAQLRAYLEFTSRYYLVSNTAGQVLINEKWPGYNFDSIAGIEYEMDLRKEPGKRLIKFQFKGSDINDTDQFTMAINAYRAEGGGGFEMIADAPVLWRSEIPVRQMMELYLSDRDEINPDDVHEVNWHFIY